MLDLLMGTREDVATIKAHVENFCKAQGELAKRVDALEQKPAQRYNAGVTAAISSTIGAIVGGVITTLAKG
jgi:hypothetical protein